jgi:DNA-binding transcriptional ArsR family regulator
MATSHVHPRPGHPQAPADLLDAAAALFRAIGEPSRLRLLVELSHGERCVTDVADQLGEPLSAVSHRLRLLRGERLVVRRRDGRHVYYALADHHVGDLITNALAHAREHLEEAR